MDPMMAGAPSPTLRRQGPLDIAALPPHIQQQLASGQPFTAEDGSTIYPDGTFTGAGDSPGDYDYGPGGFNGLVDAGMPSATLGGGGQHMMPDGTMMSGDMGGGMMGPMDMTAGGPTMGPQFERYFATANAPFPGTPGGVGGGPLTEGTMPDPFADAPAAAVEDPFFLAGPEAATAPADAVAARREMGGASPPQPSGGSYGGRMGRRMTSRTTSTRPMPGGRRR